MSVEERPLSERVGVRHGRANARQMFAIGAVASVCGIALALLINWFPVPGSKQAGPIDTMWDVLLIVSVPIFVLMQTIVLYCVWKFRMRAGEELLDGPPIHGNTRLEVIWTAVPATLLVGLCTYAYVVLTDIEKAQANTMRIRVVAEQFAWTFYYPGQNGGRELASPVLYLPAGRPVQFTIQSKDVLHDFWVPAFRIKKDAVPGIDTSYRITPTRTGTYPVVCNELCGLGHAVMRSTVNVVSPGRFQQWLQQRRARAANPAAGAPAAASTVARGAPSGAAALFTADDTRCGACHTLAAAGTHATIGPNLDKVLRGQSKASIRASIVRPSAKIRDGYTDAMPPNRLSSREVDALVDYLSQVTR